MSKSLLLDTSVIIDYLRRNDKGNNPIISLSKIYKYKISIITHTELYVGRSIWENPQAKRTFLTLLSNIKIIPLTRKISEVAGNIKSKHNSIDLLDSIIAATAINQKLELVTFNIKDFEKIKGIELFKLPN